MRKRLLQTVAPNQNRVVPQALHYLIRSYTVIGLLRLKTSSVSSFFTGQRKKIVQLYKHFVLVFGEFLAKYYIAIQSGY